VEYYVNQLFSALIDVPGLGLANTVLTYTLDLRKKLELIEIILRNRAIDVSATLKRVHVLHDLRNIIAHWPFTEDLGGFSCDFLEKHGHGDFSKPGTRARDNLITYEEFDAYDAEASALYEKLEELLESVEPITDDDLRKAIVEAAISSSDNVVRFPNKDTDETQ
jgi:hypothetical protein